MKRIMLMLLILAIGSGAMMGQTTKADADSVKKVEKAAKKAADAAEQMALYNEAMEAINAKDFVLEAERIDFKRGNYVYVNSNVNFVSMKDNKATIQLAFNFAPSGPNGIGGITVEGIVSNPVIKTNKKGEVSLSMMVQGVAVSANVTIRMFRGSNKCTATVTPNFNGNRISFVGNLYQTEASNVFKGRSI